MDNISELIDQVTKEHEESILSGWNDGTTKDIEPYLSKEDILKECGNENSCVLKEQFLEANLEDMIPKERSLGEIVLALEQRNNLLKKLEEEAISLEEKAATIRLNIEILKNEEVTDRLEIYNNPNHIKLLKIYSFNKV
jgi:hypothetical protein